MIDLFSEISANTTILTPNRRLAATLFKKYNEDQRDKGNQCWPRLDILPLTNWVERVWHQYSASHIESTPLILTTHQEKVLWEEILNQFPPHEALLQLSETAELAKSAFNILTQWRVSSDHDAFTLTEDSQAFQSWAKQFKKKCEEHNWLDSHRLLDVVCEKIEKKHINLPDQLILIGFTEYTPQQKHLFSRCALHNTQIIYSSESTTHSTQTCKRISLTDEETEILSMARWAKALFHPSQSKNIGCVIPHLEKMRDKILHTFTQVFSAEKTFTLNPTVLPFNISAGKTLATYPVIYSALQLLSLTTQTPSHDDIIHLLHSPFIGDAENERIKRAHFDSRLRQLNQTFQSIYEVLHNNEKINLTNACPQLAKRMESYLQFFSTIKKTQAPSDWVPVFMELLTILGWPGERSVNSQEYQVIQRFLELLDEYQLLDHVVSSQTYQEALHYLKSLANKTIFQIQTPDAPIQILGLLEAAEIPFDYLWVMGLDDTTWPPSAKPNPFIPHHLQKTLNMPHANAERELTYSMQLMTQLKQHAKQVIFSHAQKNADSELRPSSLITNIPEITLDELNLPEDLTAAHIIFQSRDLELIMDDQAPPIMNHEEIKGGVTIFKQQAACPFKAFSEIRLHAKKLESLKKGLRSEDRGTILHHALEQIWRTLKNSDNLKDMPACELTSLIHECSIKAIEKVTGKKIHDTRYLFLELQRLEKLLSEWLALEKNRPPFTVISQEKEQSILIGTIPLTLRVDRIDEFPDGSQLIIDYKTGKNNQIKYWFTERPEEPQLPLYCLLEPDHAVGIAFAEIHPDQLTFKGISKNDMNIPAITPLIKVHYANHREWSQQITDWKTILHQLGNDFYQGNAQVNPKEDETCHYCHLHALCRKHETIEPL